jgi:hypothetical protein
MMKTHISVIGFSQQTLATLLLVSTMICSAQTPVAVPMMWDDAAMANLELPPAEAINGPVHAPASFYYSIPIRPIYKQYPVYAPGREPAGYLDMLKKQEPVVIWDGKGTQPQLHTEADWIAAGELVFDATIFTSAGPTIFTLGDVQNPDWFKKSNMPLTPDGRLPFLNYVIREKGRLELGSFACGMCHTRVMPGGAILKGAQGNMPFGAALALTLNVPPPLYRVLYGVPWLHPDPVDRVYTLSSMQLAAALRAAPAGVLARHQASIFDPVQIPDLIGIKDRHYLDRTGLQQHRSAADLMRYAALNQGADFLSNFNGFIPADVPNFRRLPSPTDPAVGGRYSDEQLYALTLYLYSLKPPPNPNKMTPEASRGAKLFANQGCPVCHTAPLYTSNKLTPAEGFTIPEGHREKYDVLPISVGTDPGLALRTRRGTGYYKVPSLKGVWYRSMFGHSGWCATLEDWFDPRRLDDDYIPTGFKPFDQDRYPVRGHPFGLTLSDTDRKALIAFLKTL